MLLPHSVELSNSQNVSDFAGEERLRPNPASSKVDAVITHLSPCECLWRQLSSPSMTSVSACPTMMGGTLHWDGAQCVHRTNSKQSLLSMSNGPIFSSQYRDVFLLIQLAFMCSPFCLVL